MYVKLKPLLNLKMNAGIFLVMNNWFTIDLSIYLNLLWRGYSNIPYFSKCLCMS